MRCSRCEFNNPPGMKFCGQCATPLTTAPSMAAPSPQTYTPAHLAEKILTAKAALEGERKQVPGFCRKFAFSSVWASVSH